VFVLTAAAVLPPRDAALDPSVRTPPSTSPNAGEVEGPSAPAPAVTHVPPAADAVALDDARLPIATTPPRFTPPPEARPPVPPPGIAGTPRDRPPKGVATGRGKLIAAGVIGGIGTSIRLAEATRLIVLVAGPSSDELEPFEEGGLDSVGTFMTFAALGRALPAAASVATWALVGGGAEDGGRYVGWSDAIRETPARFDIDRERRVGKALIGVGLFATTFAATGGLIIPTVLNDPEATIITLVTLNDVAHITGSALVTAGAFRLGRANGYAVGRKQGSTWGRVSELRIAPQAALGGGGLSLSGRF
jgi:hypothetical protein